MMIYENCSSVFSGWAQSGAFASLFGSHCGTFAQPFLVPPTGICHYLKNKLLVPRGWPVDLFYIGVDKNKQIDKIKKKNSLIYNREIFFLTNNFWKLHKAFEIHQDSLLNNGYWYLQPHFDEATKLLFISSNVVFVMQRHENWTLG